ncbi:unnamed protein product, partial [Ectocarpus sp. 4 AP-2014]
KEPNSASQHPHPRQNINKGRGSIETRRVFQAHGYGDTSIVFGKRHSLPPSGPIPIKKTYKGRYYGHSNEKHQHQTAAQDYRKQEKRQIIDTTTAYTITCPISTKNDKLFLPPFNPTVTTKHTGN